MQRLKWIAGIGLLIYAIFKLKPIVKDLIDAHKQQEEKSERIKTMEKDLEHISMSYKCESCGSSMTIDPKHISTFCPFCGAALPKAEELIRKSYEYADKDADRKLELERLKADERKDKRTNRLLLIILTPFLLFLLALIALLFKGN